MIIDEFRENFLAFELDQGELLNSAYAELGRNTEVYLKSYVRLSSFQAWHEYILVGNFSEDVFKFFVEAQNDALISHVLARQGMWRPSLQSLRSCLENILICHYYSDHPVELQQWATGEHKIGFAELRQYYENHPKFKKFDLESRTCLSQLKSEYSDLSKAVHGSSTSFLMGDKSNVPNLAIPNRKNLGQWETRQKLCLHALNLFLIIFHQEKLQGTAYPAMRKALANVFEKAMIRKIKDNLGVVIQT